MKKTLITTLLTAICLAFPAFAQNQNKPMTAPLTIGSDQSMEVNAVKRPIIVQEVKYANPKGMACEVSATPTFTHSCLVNPKPKKSIVLAAPKPKAPIVVESKVETPIVINNNINNINNNAIKTESSQNRVRPRGHYVGSIYHYDDGGYWSEGRYHRELPPKKKTMRKDELTDSALYIYGGFTQVKAIGAEYEFRASHLGLGLYFEHNIIDAVNDNYNLIKGNQGGIDLHYHFKDRDKSLHFRKVEFGVFACVGLGKFTYGPGNTFNAVNFKGGVDIEIPVYQQLALFGKVSTDYIKLPDNYYRMGENVALGIRYSF